MKKRQWAIVAGIGVLVLAFLLNRWLAATPQERKAPKQAPVKAVEVFEVQNGAVPVTLKLDGKLTALQKIDLFAEVSGVLQSGGKRFEEGIAYQKGEALLKLNSDEAQAAYLSAKSEYINRLTQSLPDIKLDYPDAFEIWNSYLTKTSRSEMSPPPQAENQQLNLFLTGRGIYSAYQNLSSAQTRRSKYRITAPFNGVLTEAMVNPGMLVRAGQPLGEFIAPNLFELEATLGFEELQLVSIGDTVRLESSAIKGNWKGIIFRKNAKIDPATQRVKVFVRIESDKLTDGMYMNGTIKANNVEDALAIDRNLLYDKQFVYVLKHDSLLQKQRITVLQKGATQVIIRGLENGTKMPKKQIVGAYNGMEVNVLLNK